MKTPVPLYTSDRELSLLELCSLKPFALDRDWQNNKVSWNIHFALALDPSAFHYTVWMPFGPEAGLKCLPSDTGSDFVEGLWEKDVAELFFKSDTSDAYQEINLAPNGDWWSARFTGYRIRDSISCEMNNVSTFSRNGNEYVNFGMSIPRSELRVDISFSQDSRMFVTAIANTPEQQFLIWAPPETSKPDFHLMDQAPGLRLLPLG